MVGDLSIHANQILENRQPVASGRVILHFGRFRDLREFLGLLEFGRPVVEIIGRLDDSLRLNQSFCVAMNNFLIFAQATPVPAGPSRTEGPSDWIRLYEQAWHWVAENGLVFVRNLIVAAAIFFIGRVLANVTKGVLVRILDGRAIDQTVSRFVANIASTVIMIMVLITALGQLGIPTAQFAALIAAAGLAIGLALQSNLSNFAAGFLLIFFRPFKKGDYVAGGGIEGIVEEVGVFSTTMTTADNKLIIVPNSKLTADNITNFTANDKRRVDLTFVAGAQNKPSVVRDALMEVVAANSKVLQEPAPGAFLKDCNGKLVFELRVWCRSEEYWNVHFGLTEAVANQFVLREIGGPISSQVIQLAK